MKRAQALKPSTPPFQYQLCRLLAVSLGEWRVHHFFEEGLRTYAWQSGCKPLR